MIHDKFKTTAAVGPKIDYSFSFEKFRFSRKST
jgi:hypothetical protein